MTPPLLHRLSRRQRQIMEAIYLLGSATAVQVLDAMADPPGLSAVRKMITLLEAKGYLSHVQEDQHFRYSPAYPREDAAKLAMQQVLQTFFGGDLSHALAAMLSEAGAALSDEDAARLVSLIEDAKSSSQNGAFDKS